MQYENFKSKDGVQHYKVKVVTKRNDQRLNNNQQIQPQGWRANCDIQVIIDYHSCMEYIAKYASKAEKISSVAREAFQSVFCESSNQNDTNRALRTLMMKAVGQRDMSNRHASNTFHQTCKFYISSNNSIPLRLP